MATMKKSNPYAGRSTEAAYARADSGAKKRAAAVAKAGRAASKQAQAESAVARKRAATPAGPRNTRAAAIVGQGKARAAAKAANYSPAIDTGAAGRGGVRMGVKKGDVRTERIRATEWAYKKAQRKANVRAKVRTKTGIASRKSIAADKKAGKKSGMY